MKIKVELLFKSGSRKSCEVEWGKDAGVPQPETVNSAAAIGHVTTKGSMVRWNPSNVDFIEVDGQFDEIIKGKDEDQEMVDLDVEPTKTTCKSCGADMWLDVMKTDLGMMMIGECPRCGVRVSNKLQSDDNG